MYHVVQSESYLYTVGTGTPGQDWEPVADHSRYDVAQADAERRNTPQAYALLDKMQRQIDQLSARVAALETDAAISMRVDNENNPDFHGY